MFQKHKLKNKRKQKQEPKRNCRSTTKGVRANNRVLIREETFDRLNFTMDSDSHGRVFELSTNSEAHEQENFPTHQFQKQQGDARR